MPKPLHTPKKAIDTYAMQRAVGLTAAITIMLAICLSMTRTQWAGPGAATMFPIIGIGLLVSFIAAPIIFAWLYSRQEGYSLPRTIIWSLAAELAAILIIWTLYGWILISFA